MGIPKFFKFIAERYPCIVAPFIDSTLPSVDNLYLDMNGIIHTCTRTLTKGQTIEKHGIMKIFEYIDLLFSLIKPRQYFFMAIDGVAPRAKMNQQRTRRFRSALEREEIKKQKQRMQIPEEELDQFDSNCITPGTEFMHQLSQQLQGFITSKMETDLKWQQCKVILSGHEVPGEGEHKIMNFVRGRKTVEGKQYNPNQVHCLYGLDADLIMLALMTHEPHFFLLREEVFGEMIRNEKNRSIRSEFQLLHISVLRQYLKFDLQMPTTLPFEYSLERVIDDFILLCFLCGNDFLPHMPTLDIGEGAIQILIDIYKLVLPKLNGYITEEGNIDMDRLECILVELGKREERILEERVQAVITSKKGFKKVSIPHQQEQQQQVNVIHGDQLEQLLTQMQSTEGVLEQNQLLEEDDLIAATNVLTMEELEREIPVLLASQTEEEESIVQPVLPNTSSTNLLLDSMNANGIGFNFSTWHHIYYLNKFHIDIHNTSSEVLDHVKQCYVHGLVWVYHYYYKGCVSWKWYYPYHYAPIATDLHHLKQVQVSFVEGKPFTPFQQLMGVLPPSSNALVPKPYRFLFEEMKEWYPLEFQIDKEGCKHDYQGTVLLPFMNEEELLKALDRVDTNQLTSEEVKRNQFGTNVVYQYNQSIRVEHVPFHSMEEYSFLFRPALCEGVVDYLEHCPCLQVKQEQFECKLKKIPVKLFGLPSNYSSLVLEWKKNSMKMVEDVTLLAQSLLNTKCYIGYPFPRLCIVTSMSTKNCSIYSDMSMEMHSKEEQDAFEMEASMHRNLILQRYAMQLNSIEILVYVKLFCGMSKTKEGHVTKKFTNDEYVFPYQLLINESHYKPKKDEKFMDRKKKDTFALDYPLHTKVMNNRNGMVYQVIQNENETVKVQAIQSNYVNLLKEYYPSMLTMYSDEDLKYFNLRQVAQQFLQMNTPRFISVLIGKFSVKNSKNKEYQIGLGLRSTSKNKAIIGYAKREKSTQRLDESYFLNFTSINTSTKRASKFSIDGNYDWQVSQRAVQLLQSYFEEFPQLKEYGMNYYDTQADKNMDYSLQCVFGDATDEMLEKMKQWLEKQEFKKLPFLSLEETVLPDDLIQLLEQEFISKEKEIKKQMEESDAKIKNVILETKNPYADLYKPGDPYPLNAGSSEIGHYKIGQQVMYRSGTGQVPFGTHGVLIGIDGMYGFVVFPFEFVGGSTLANKLKTCRGQIIALESLFIIADKEKQQQQQYVKYPKQQQQQQQQVKQPVTEQSILSNTYASHYYVASEPKKFIKPKSNHNSAKNTPNSSRETTPLPSQVSPQKSSALFTKLYQKEKRERQEQTKEETTTPSNSTPQQSSSTTNVTQQSTVPQQQQRVKAPPGGITLDGKFYKGGQFLPKGYQ